MMITETLLLLKFAKYKSPLFGLKAMPFGPRPTDIMGTTSSRDIGLLHCRQQETKVYPWGPLFSASSKENKDSLLVVAAVLYMSAVRHSTVKEAKMHSTRLFVLKTLGVCADVVRSVICGDGIVDAACSTVAECFCSVYWCLKPRFLYPLSVRLPLLTCNRVWPYCWHHCIVCN